MLSLHILSCISKGKIVLKYIQKNRGKSPVYRIQFYMCVISS